MAKNEIFVRLSADFILSAEDNERVTSKYISIRDKENKEIASGELYLLGYEDEEGDECDESGKKF